jgi:NADP-dependent 3-hydroxy acid dehydrogenase YdfG
MPAAMSSSSRWQRMIDVNIKGVLYSIAAALPL